MSICRYSISVHNVITTEDFRCTYNYRELSGKALSVTNYTHTGLMVADLPLYQIVTYFTL